MFELNPDLTFVPADQNNIVSVIESINSPNVAAEGRPLEPTRAFIVGARASSGLYSIYIYLYLIQSRECMIYANDPIEIPMERYHETELVALQFVESMGFMVENLNFRKLTSDQQQEYLQSVPFSYQDLGEFAQLIKAQESGAGNADGSDLELAALEEEVIDLEDLAEVIDDQKAQLSTTVSKEGLSKIARLLSSF